jgi:glycosyltransferase involved in cell wall biosynthesis
MRVLQVYRDYFPDVPGGIERHVWEVAQGLADRTEMHLLASARRSRAREFEDGGVTVHLEAEHGRPVGVPVAPGFVRVIRKGRFDVVHLHAPNPTGESAFLRSPKSAAGVMTYHADLDRGAGFFRVYEKLLRAVTRRCRFIIASSERLISGSRFLSRAYEEDPDRLIVIPFGIDTHRFTSAPTARSLELKESWGRGPHVLFLGRLRYYKGVPVLIRALQDIDAKLIVVGDGLERHRIEEMGSGLLGERFVYVPGVDEETLPDVYRAADLFCLPSISHAEAFGISTLEAMASGLPVITTDVGTATSVVNLHGVTGLVVPANDERALAEEIERILGDASLRSEFGSAARARAEAEYNKAVMLGRIEEVYRKAVDVP